MPLNAIDLALIAATFAGILSLAVGMTFLLARSRVQMWIGGAIGRFMQSLSNQAAEEEGAGSPGVSSASSPGVGVLKLGGFSVDVRTIKELLPILPQLMEAAKMFGLLKGGAGGSGGYIRP